MASLGDAALAYAHRGWHVLPLFPGTKRPLTQHGKDDATADPAQVEAWWRKWPTANIGVQCRRSGFVAIDVDPRNGGDDSLWQLEREHGALPETLRVLTGGGGLHILFAHPGVPLRGEIGPGVEIKDAGYVVAPPSRTGRRYEWEEPDDRTGRPLALLPSRWLEAMRERPFQGHVKAPLTSSDDELRKVPAPVYVKALTGRTTSPLNFVQCPFHKGGQERTPSLKVYRDGTWACFGCPKPAGRRALGGDIYTFASLLSGINDFLELRSWLEERLNV